VDHEAAGLAARTLLELGHRKIAVIAGRAAAPDNQQRIAGFKAELEAAGIDTSKMWMEDGEFTPEGGWPARSVAAVGRSSARVLRQ
jgi:LacI family transcriptional regulator